MGYVVEAMETFAKNPALAADVRSFLVPFADSELAPVARKAKKALKALAW